MYNRLSLSDGLKIAKIVGGEFDGKFIHINRGDEKENQEFFLGMGKDKGRVEPIYHTQLGDISNRYVVSGLSGSGKTYYAKMIVDDYLKQFPDNRVILISGVPKHRDKIFTCKECISLLTGKNADSERTQKKVATCKECSKYERLKIDESILDDPLNVQDFENSLVIFDDIDRCFDRDIVAELHYLCDNLFKSGRQDSNTTIYISQKLREGVKSGTTNAGMLNLVSFPNMGSKYQLTGYMKEHLKLPTKMVNKVLDLPSRFVSINCCVPQYILHEKGCILL